MSVPWTVCICCYSRKDKHKICIVGIIGHCCQKNKDAICNNLVGKQVFDSVCISNCLLLITLRKFSFSLVSWISWRIFHQMFVIMYTCPYAGTCLAYFVQGKYGICKLLKIIFADANESSNNELFG